MLNKLKLGFGRKLPLLLQNEAAECGLACLGMVSGFYGHRFDMLTLRRRFATTLKGATLEQLMDMAGRLQLASRRCAWICTSCASCACPVCCTGI